MNKAAIYARESTQKQDIETLISICQKKASELGFEEVVVYKDVESGYSNTREEYLRMLADIKEGRVTSLILYESSRATRDEIEHHLFYRLLAQKEVKLFVINRGWVNPSDEDDMFFSSMLNLLDAREGRKTAKRVRDRMGELARQGKWTGGPPPLGYRLEDKKLLVDEEQAKVIQEVFRLFLDGQSREEISKAFGLERKRIARILTNEIYIGRVKYRQQQIVDKEIVLNKEYKTFEGEHEAIIDLATFEATQNRLKKVKRSKRNGKDYIFRGLLSCYCGRRLYPRKIRGKIYYTCNSKSVGDNCGSRSFTQDELIDKVIEAIKASLESFCHISDEGNEEELEGRREFYERELKKLEKQEENLLRKYLEGTVKEKIYNKFVEELKEKSILYRAELGKVEGIISNRGIKEDSIELLGNYIAKLEKTKDLEKLRKLFNIIIMEIVFVNDFRCRAILNI